MADYLTNTTDLTSVADAIRDRTGKTAALEFPDDFVEEIENIQSGIPRDIDSGVLFIDYDGTELHYWTSASVAGRTALPGNPSRTGLVAQGWNWGLADIKSYIASYPTAVVVVGQMYTTVSGLTEFDITLTDFTGLTVTLLMEGEKNWGDGTIDEETEHTYSAMGNYTITCDGDTIPESCFDEEYNETHFCTALRIGSNVTSIEECGFELLNHLQTATIPNNAMDIGCCAFDCCTYLKSVTLPSSAVSIDDTPVSYAHNAKYISYPPNATSFSIDWAYNLMHLTIPAGVTEITERGFEYFYGLRSVVITENITDIGNYAFLENRLLKSVTFTGTVTTIEYGAFSGCFSLEDIELPTGITSIPDYLFDECRSLRSVRMPSGILEVSNSAFEECYALEELDFTRANSVPILEGNLPFYSNKYRILVPLALESQWKAATNWSEFADHIVGV